MYIIMCIFIHAVKNTTICQTVVLCNKQHYVIIQTLGNTTCKLPEDGVLTPKHVGIVLILILRYLFVHVLVRCMYYVVLLII